MLDELRTVACFDDKPHEPHVWTYLHPDDGRRCPGIPTGPSPLDEPQISQSDRASRYFWPLVRVTEHGRQGWAGLQLSAYHNRDRKQFYASVLPVTYLDDGGTRTSVSLMSAPAWTASKPVDRFSAKALDSFATAALAGLRGAWTAGDPAVRALFTVSESATTPPSGKD
jgi:hypothetical protein